MSEYLPQLCDTNNIGFDDTQKWQETDITRLITFAEKLYTEDSAKTDVLSSVPTPWARLLLFETALYRPSHPAHETVVDQWRGLLGVLALHKLLTHLTQ